MTHRQYAIASIYDVLLTGNVQDAATMVQLYARLGSLTGADVALMLTQIDLTDTTANDNARAA